MIVRYSIFCPCYNSNTFTSQFDCRGLTGLCALTVKRMMELIRFVIFIIVTVFCYNTVTPYGNKLNTSQKESPHQFSGQYLDFCTFIIPFIYMGLQDIVQLQFDTILIAKDPELTDFEDDLHTQMPFQKSHFFILQIIEWLINNDTFAREALQCNAWLSPL